MIVKIEYNNIFLNRLFVEKQVFFPILHLR